MTIFTATSFALFLVGLMRAMHARKIVRLTHAMFPEAPNVTFLHNEPFYGIEFRVWKEHWAWIGYVTREYWERGW